MLLIKGKVKVLQQKPASSHYSVHYKNVRNTIFWASVFVLRYIWYNNPIGDIKSLLHTSFSDPHFNDALITWLSANKVFWKIKNNSKPKVFHVIKAMPCIGDSEDTKQEKLTASLMSFCVIEG